MQSETYMASFFRRLKCAFLDATTFYRAECYIQCVSLVVFFLCKNVDSLTVTWHLQKRKQGIYFCNRSAARTKRSLNPAEVEVGKYSEKLHDHGFFSGPCDSTVVVGSFYTPNSTNALQILSASS